MREAPRIPQRPLAGTSGRRALWHLKAEIGAISLIYLWAAQGYAIASPPLDFDRLVDAIYLAEGGGKARKPFGILSVPCSGYQDCRQVCLNTVRNTYRRWLKAGQPGDYLNFLALRYAPPTAHPLNAHWERNVRRLYARR